MIDVSNVRLPLDAGLPGNEALVTRAAAQALGIQPGEIGEVKLLRRSVDARKGEVRFIATLAVALLDESAESALLALGERTGVEPPKRSKQSKAARKKGRERQGQKATSGRGLLHDRESSLLLVDGAGLGPPRCVMAAGPRARGLRIPFGWREGSRGRVCRGLPRPPPRGAGPASRPARRPQAGAPRGFPP